MGQNPTGRRPPALLAATARGPAALGALCGKSARTMAGPARRIRAASAGGELWKRLGREKRGFKIDRSARRSGVDVPSVLDRK